MTDGAGGAAPTMPEQGRETSVLAGHGRHTIGDVRETYREQAATMARMDWLNRAFTGRYRRRLFGDATGRVLDVACGVGTNVQYLPEESEYVGIDISRDVIAAAEQRLDDRTRETTLYEMDAQNLGFPIRTSSRSTTSCSRVHRTRPTASFTVRTVPTSLPG